MLFSSWLRNWQRSAPAASRRTQTSVRQRPSFRPRLEALEDRTLLTGSIMADLSIEPTGDPSGSGTCSGGSCPVAAGAEVTYSMTVTNNTSSSENSVTLTDQLPANTTLVSWTAAAGWSSSAPPTGSSRGTVSASIDSLAPNSSATFTLVVAVDGSTAVGTMLSNTAFLASLTDPANPSNTSISFNNTVGYAPTVQVVDGGGTYNGNPFPATATAVGSDGTTPVAGSLSYTYYAGTSASGTPMAAVPVNAGTYTVVAFFESSDPNYSDGSAQTTFTIGQATSATTTVGAGPFTYTGSAKVGGAGTVTGAGGLSTSATSLTYSANSDGTGVADQTDAGTYYVTAHYAGDANHTPSNGAAVGITINPAPLPVTVTSDLMLANRDRSSPPPLTGTVNGIQFTGSTTFTTAQGDTLTITLSSAVTAISPVGVYPIIATVTGAATANYVQPTPANMYVVTVGNDSGTGAKNVSFWDNKGNANLITAADLTALDQLDLVNNNAGSDFDPATAAQLQRWFRSDTDSIAKALSIQLGVMDLNVLSGNVNAANVVYAGNLLRFVGSSYDVTGLDGGGFITIGNLMTLANNALAQYTSPGKGDNDHDGLGHYLDALEDALEAANNNTSFVQQAVPAGI